MLNRQRIEPGDGDPRHGTDNGYVNLGCRCDPCRQAHTERIADYRQSVDVRRRRNRLDRERRAKLREQRPPPPPPEPKPPKPQRELLPHGTRAAALRHWRKGEPPCPPCLAAQRDHVKSLDQRRKEK